jgi:hypothetical protein
MRTIESTTAEKLPVVITSPSDPTGSAVEFALTTTTTQPTTWVAGSWAGTWDTTTGTASALSPLIGAGQALAIAAGTDYDLWVRWTITGSETPVRLVDRYRVT